MAEVIPIATNPAPVRSLPIPQTGAVRRSVGHWTDTRGRPLRDLRISVTDHCNFRCRYCMPKEKFSNPHAFLAHTELLTFEEILRIARIVVANGVEKLRLTGGEPLLRKGLEELVAELRRLRTPDGRDIDIALLAVNQPFTMTVDQAVEAVKAIRPKIFYPYHYGEVDEKTDLDRLTRELEGITEVRIRPME